MIWVIYQETPMRKADSKPFRKAGSEYQLVILRIVTIVIGMIPCYVTLSTIAMPLPIDEVIPY